jgi:hypothetical protein
MVPLEGCARDREAGDGHPVASGRVPAILGVRSRPKGGRPAIDPEVRGLIRRMATVNLWGAPRIHGEL